MTAQARSFEAPTFTVPALANRWKCSEGLIRKMIKRGEIKSFRLGTLIRIPAEEVGKVECQSNTQSNDSEDHTLSSGETKLEQESEAGSTPKIARARRPRPVGAGLVATIHRGPWAD